LPRKEHTAEEIVAKLRQVDALTAQGRPVAETGRRKERTQAAAAPAFRIKVSCQFFAVVEVVPRAKQSSYNHIAISMAYMFAVLF